MNAAIREILMTVAGQSVDISELKDDTDLYAAGLSSFASVQLMLGLEEHFEIEFPDALLKRQSFATLAAIEETVKQILKGREAA